jgi:hypothetical protein
VATEGNLANISNRVVSAEGNLANVSNRVGLAEGNLANVSNRVDAAEGNIVNVSNRVGLTEENLANVSNRADTTFGWGNWATNLPVAGCTDLGTATAVALTGATIAYRAAPSGTYTVSVAAAANRMCCYVIDIYGSSACTLAAGLNLLGTWTPAETNQLGIYPGTNGTWNVLGRSL